MEDSTMWQNAVAFRPKEANKDCTENLRARDTWLLALGSPSEAP